MFYGDGVDDWFVRGVLPLLFGWLTVAIVYLVYEWSDKELRHKQK